MLGLTLIHLSDLHVSHEPESKSVHSAHEIADFTAEMVASDLSTLSREHGVPFRTNESFIVVTGDITTHSSWQEYEIALVLFRRLREEFGKRFPGQELLPGHIVCIPGNHDLEIPEQAVRPPTAALRADERYRNFKLFLDEVTNHAEYSRRFRLSSPNVNAQFFAPFPVQFLDLCTSANIHAYRVPPPRTQVYLTDDHLRYLSRLLGQDDVFKVALMHHFLGALPAEDQGAQRSQETVRAWLLENGFRLVLSGHGHRSTGTSSTHFNNDGGLWELGTGHSFLRREQKGNFYQVLRIEPREDGEITAYKRIFSWPTEYLDREQNLWDPEKRDSPQKRLKIPGLRRQIVNTDYRQFIGIGDADHWAVIAHCESAKFRNYGVLSPGEEVNRNLLGISGCLEGHLDTVDEKLTSLKWDSYVGRDALFLVDSPHYNPYVRWILLNYTSHMCGGSVVFVDEPDKSDVKQRIEVLPGEPLRSTKSKDQKLFDRFRDYLLVMRLPWLVPVRRHTSLEVSDIDRSRVIWVIAGIHSKASYAGAMILTPVNLEKFQTSIQRLSGGRIPDYFEAVYELPVDPPRVEDFDLLRNVHFRVLRLNSEVAMSDELPSGVVRRFARYPSGHSVPIEIAHIDPVAACNCSCPSCIEKNLRGKKLCLSLKAYSNVICQLRSVGCGTLNFYGGEPTLHPDFPEMVSLAADIGFHMMVVTNGTRLQNGEVMRALAAAKERVLVRLSLDADSEVTHCRSHGLSEEAGLFTTVVKGAHQLIREGVPTIVSFLLHEDSIDEVDGAFVRWRDAGAAALLLRPVTAIGGRDPHLNYTRQQRRKIKKVLDRGRTFVFAPRWFEQWLDDQHDTSHPQKEYRRCYSAYYRVAISPLRKSRGGRRLRSDGVVMTETDDAWLSLCTYHRYDPAYGVPFPVDLKTWLMRDRSKYASRINPSEQCRGVACCRHELNREVSLLLEEEMT